jgi:hypothetical protein
MILTSYLIAEELLTVFKVIKVHQEPRAESKWTLQFEDYEPITYFDKCFRTIEEDEKLAGKKIKAQIDLEVFDEDIILITNPEEQKKSITYIPTGSVIVTGVYMDDVHEIESKYDTEYITSALDSIYRLHLLKTLNSNKFNLKKGDWIKVITSERNIILARQYIPFTEEL